MLRLKQMGYKLIARCMQYKTMPRVHIVYLFFSIELTDHYALHAPIPVLTTSFKESGRLQYSM